MGNNNSAAYSKGKGGKAAKVASTEPRHVPMQRKPSTTKAEKVRLGVYPEMQHGEKPLVNDDDTFTKYIQHAKHKLRSLSNVGRHHHEEQRNPAPDHHHVANDVNSSNKENESDKFSDFIQNARKKLRTVSTMGKGKDSGR